MLSVASVRSAGGAASYFAADNYYTREQGQGEWFGKGAEALGVTGKIDPKIFEALLQGRLPDGSRVGREGIHRAGIDLTFSMPKSWSLIALVGGDRRIVEAYGEAVKATLAWAERNAAQARIDTGKGQCLVSTGNLVVGLFEHDTSRAQEPQGHFHAVVANVTQLPSGEWRALRNDRLWSLNTLLNSMTMARFRMSVEALGYRVGDRSKHGNFEAAGIARNMVMAFSTRRQQILAKVAAMASRTPEAFHAATLMTREDKAPIEDRGALYAGWRETAAEIGLDLAAIRAEADARLALQPGIRERIGEAVAPIVTKARELASGFASALGLRRDDPYLPKTFPNKTPAEIAAAHAVASAIRHLEQREAGFALTDVYKAALDFGLPTTIGEVERAAARQIANGNLHRGIDERAGMVTTAQALDIERRILAGVDAGRGAVAPVLSADLAADSLQAFAVERSGFALNAGQEAAGRMMFASTDRTVAIQGVAGAGKSSVLAPAARLFEAQGRKVIGLAVQNTLVRTLERETGVPSMTVARFIKTYGGEASSAGKESLRGNVLIVDEASMLANADQLKLIEIANRYEVGRLIFVGDSRQLGAVDAGKPFALVQDAGIETVRMDQNVRAREDAVRAVAVAAQAGEVAKAMELLGGRVIEAEGGVVEQAARQWLSLPKAEREQTMIFASGRRLRDAVNASVQEGLKQAGELGEQSLRLQVLDRVNLTNEELRYSHHYHPGRVVELSRAIREQRLEPGRYVVTGVDRNGRIQMRDERGKPHRFLPDRVRLGHDNRLALYDRKDRTIHAGDRIRWTANDHERGLLNADRATVTGIGKGRAEIETSSGMKLSLAQGDPMLARIDLAYAYNAHMAQGMTADRAIVVMESRDTKLLTRQNFLVSVTRVRDELTVYVDRADRAKAKLELQSSEKRSALQTIGEVEKKPELERTRVKPFEIGL
ncbi:MAG: conjugative relaxase [Xanthobacteraceae bacterium]|nr:conjugative relaxase [Xanthobacteraceae bacterium]